MFNKTYTDMDTIYCKMTESSTGEYVNSEGVRFNLEWGHHIQAPDGRCNEELGYIPFSSLSEAATYFGLTKYSDKNKSNTDTLPALPEELT